MWSKPGFWHGWSDLFEAAGYAPLAPGWPAKLGGAAAPETIGEVAAHMARIAGALDRRPALIGHSFGGLIAQILAGRGLSAATVAIEPASLGGMLLLPVSTEAAGDAGRGPLLVVSCERDHTLPPSVTRAVDEQHRRDKHAVTEFIGLPRHVRPLTIEGGWQEVAQTALTFVRRFL